MPFATIAGDLPKFIPRGAGPKKSKREQNADRQRAFRERNPGYYGRLHRQRKAELEAFGERLRLERELAAQQQAIVTTETAQVVATAEARPAVLVEERVKPSAEPSAAVPGMQAPSESEALLLFLLMTAIAKLQRHRADTAEWPAYRAA